MLQTPTVLKAAFSTSSNAPQTTEEASDNQMPSWAFSRSPKCAKCVGPKWWARPGDSTTPTVLYQWLTLCVTHCASIAMGTTVHWLYKLPPTWSVFNNSSRPDISFLKIHFLEWFTFVSPNSERSLRKRCSLYFSRKELSGKWKVTNLHMETLHWRLCHNAEGTKTFQQLIKNTCGNICMKNICWTWKFEELSYRPTTFLLKLCQFIQRFFITVSKWKSWLFMNNEHPNHQLNCQIINKQKSCSRMAKTWLKSPTQLSNCLFFFYQIVTKK